MSTIAEPSWLIEARKYLGMKEIPGTKHNKTIVEFMENLSGGSIRDDETAWCGGFTGFILKKCGLALPKNPLSARAYLDLPNYLDRPAVGAVAVLYRGDRNGWMGHVGFVVGRDVKNNIMVLSGNHNNMVDIAAYQWQGPGNRLLGFRWPSIAPRPERFNLPIVAATSSGGGSEA